MSKYIIAEAAHNHNNMSVCSAKCTSYQKYLKMKLDILISFVFVVKSFMLKKKIIYFTLSLLFLRILHSIKLKDDYEN
jgi:hypothetical protein